MTGQELSDAAWQPEASWATLGWIVMGLTTGHYCSMTSPDSHFSFRE